MPRCVPISPARRASHCSSNDSPSCCRSRAMSVARACTWLPMKRRFRQLRAELAARRGIGLACEWLDGDAVRGRFGCQRPGAILSALGAQVDPYRLTRGLFASCVRHGLRLFARTKVIQIEEQGEQLKLRTAGGHTVTASHVVVCAGYESLDFLPDGFADVNNTFALVTEPLSRSGLATMPLMWESARPYLYLRSTPDRRLIVGGADVPFKNAGARDLLLPRQVRRLAGTVPRVCSARNCRRWPTPGREASRRPATACR